MDITHSSYPKKKTLRAVLLGISQIIPIGEVSYLVDVGFDIVAIFRFHRKIKEAKIELSLILGQISQYSNNMFKLTKLGHKLFKVGLQKPGPHMYICISHYMLKHACI